jgi:dethiobiotin synthetase
LIEELNCPVIAVARNSLGTINHTLLTVNTLLARTKKPIKVVLMDQARPDFSAQSNLKIVAETLGKVPVLPFPFLGARRGRGGEAKNNAKKVKLMLASLLG